MERGAMLPFAPGPHRATPPASSPIAFSGAMGTRRNLRKFPRRLITRQTGTRFPLVFLSGRGSVGPRSSGQFRSQQHGSGEVLALGDVALAMPSPIAAMTERVTTKDLIAQHNLTDEEYKKIVESSERRAHHGAKSH